MPAKVILNPYSNRWNAQKRWPEAQAALKAAGVDYSYAISESRGQAEELAYQAALAGFSPIVAAGGDGTIGEVVNGLARARGETDLGIIGLLPLGTANDLVHNLGLPLDLVDAARVIAAGHTRPLDVGKAGERYFVNNSALGLEPYVTTIQQGITRLKGIPRYLAAALLGIGRNPKWQARVEWDDGHYEGPLTLISVGNAPLTGGLFYMAPHADPYDGRLTAVIAYKATSFGLLALLPQAMSPEGKFVHSPGVREIHTTHLSVRLEPGSPAHCDGELFPTLVDRLDYSILPGRLKVLMPNIGQ